MSWYALETLQDTFNETKDFLWPFKLGRWLRLAVIVFFVGGSGNSFIGQINSFSGFSEERFGEGSQTDVTNEALQEAIPEAPELTALIIGVLIAVFLLILVFSYISSVFQFVFFRSLYEKEEKDISIRSSFKQHVFDGLKYLVFRWIVIIIVFASIGILVAGFITSIPLGILLTLVMIPLWILIWFVSFAVVSLTLPEMVSRQRGFVESLKQTYNYVTDEWKQAIAFILVSVAVGIVASIITGIGFIIGLIILGIPLILLGVLLYFVQPLLVAIPVVIGIAGLFVVYFAFAVPVQSYIYQWFLNVHAEFASTHIEE